MRLEVGGPAGRRLTFDENDAPYKRDSRLKTEETPRFPTEAHSSKPTAEVPKPGLSTLERMLSLPEMAPAQNYIGNPSPFLQPEISEVDESSSDGGVTAPLLGSS